MNLAVRTLRLPFLVLSLAFGGLCVGAFAQSAEDAARAQELLRRIRSSMREVNVLLLRGAATGAQGKAEETVRDLDQLLGEAESRSDAIARGIDELIEMANQQPPPPSGGGGGGEPPPQQDKNQGQQPPREKSQDPQELQQQPKDANQPQDEKPEGDKPKDRPDAEQPPEQKNASDPPPGGETGSFTNENTAGRWGVLPPKQAEDLLRHDVEEFPQRYRTWMEMYLRRVNRSRDG